MNARRRQIGAAGAALLIVMTGCQSAGSPSGHRSASPTATAPVTADTLPGCLPECMRGHSRPGALAAGTFRSRWFFGGALTLDLGPGWSSSDDSNAELALAHASPSAGQAFLWEDVYPVNAGQRVAGVRTGAAALLNWLTTNSQLSAAPPEEAAIGPYPGISVEVRVADRAVNDDPSCPVRVCRQLLGFGQWPHSWDIARGEVQRIRLVDIAYGRSQHLLVAVERFPDPRHMDGFGELIDRVLESVRIPAHPA